MSLSKKTLNPYQLQKIACWHSWIKAQTKTLSKEQQERNRYNKHIHKVFNQMIILLLHLLYFPRCSICIILGHKVEKILFFSHPMTSCPLGKSFFDPHSPIFQYLTDHKTSCFTGRLKRRSRYQLS